MQTRRDFILNTSGLVIGSLFVSKEHFIPKKLSNAGIQLYTFRKELMADAIGTLNKIAGLGFKQIESAASEKGHYYGLTAKEMKQACADLGMTLRSGHVQMDENWQQTIAEAVDAGQEYLICSSMPSKGQTIDNYKKVAEQFNKAGEQCKQAGVKFGYHNHAYEFESDNGQVLYSVLLNHTEANLVHMEMDLGWVIVGGKSPLDYFKLYPGRFPLWHLKDMDIAAKHSVEFGKGQLEIKQMLQHAELAGAKYIFVEQEEYAVNPAESMKENMEYLKKLRY